MRTKFEKSFKVVSFDLDGTLINTLPDIARACNATLARVGLPIHPVMAYAHFVGNGARKLCERASNLEGEALCQFETLYREEYLEHLIVESKVYDGIEEIAGILSERGKRLVVFTNKPQKNAEQIVSRLLNKVSFGKIIGQCASTPCKPDSTGILELCREWQILPEEVVHIGDSIVDVQTACSAGMASIGAAWGFLGNSPFLENPKPDWIAQNPVDILSIDLLK